MAYTRVMLLSFVSIKMKAVSKLMLGCSLELNIVKFIVQGASLHTTCHRSKPKSQSLSRVHL